jgi:hypothetical protein
MDAWGARPARRFTPQTFLGHPVGCAMALATLAEIERLLPSVHASAARLRIGIEKHGLRVRGRGLALGVELKDALRRAGRSSSAAGLRSPRRAAARFSRSRRRSCSPRSRPRASSRRSRPSHDPRTDRSIPPTGEGDFAELALALHAWQREHNADLRAFVGDAPLPARWEEIPAVPVSLFRDLALTSFDLAETKVVFRTSGTTSGRRGAVRLRDTELYDLGRGCTPSASWTDPCTRSVPPSRSRGQLARAHVPDIRPRCGVARGSARIRSHGRDRGAARRPRARVRRGHGTRVPRSARARRRAVHAPSPVTRDGDGRLQGTDPGRAGRRARSRGAERIPGRTGRRRVRHDRALLAALGEPDWLAVRGAALARRARGGSLDGRARGAGTLAVLRSRERRHRPRDRDRRRRPRAPVRWVELFGRLPGAEPRGCSLTIEELPR